MKQIILTAFDRFGSYRTNPSQEIADRLEGRTLAGYRFSTIVFRCEISPYDRG